MKASDLTPEHLENISKAGLHGSAAGEALKAQFLYGQRLAELTYWYNETMATLFGDNEREELRQTYSEKVADLQYERHKALQRLDAKDDNSPSKAT